jgi:hypothetical protein
LSTRKACGRPQRAKARRSSACTAAGGTPAQRAWGENFGPQGGAGALVDDPQPADALPGLEPDQLGGVHLPDLVRLAGPLGVGGRAAAGGRRAEAGLVEPALQGAHGGQVGAGVAAAEEDADEAGAPAGVVAAEGEGLVPELAGGRGLAAAAAAVGGRESLAAAVAEAAEEGSDGTGREAEGAGDGGGGLALAVAPQDDLAEW